MPSKTVPLSVRLTPDEAAFLAEYHAPGARTLSEKVRIIIDEARTRSTGHTDYVACLTFMDEIIGPRLKTVRHDEARLGIHSELLLLMGHWLPEASATLIAHQASEAPEENRDRLEKLEAELADRVFNLFEQVLRLAVTGESPCYAPDTIVSRLGKVEKLSDILKDSLIKGKG